MSTRSKSLTCDICSTVIHGHEKFKAHFQTQHPGTVSLSSFFSTAFGFCFPAERVRLPSPRLWLAAVEFGRAEWPRQRPKAFAKRPARLRHLWARFYEHPKSSRPQKYADHDHTVVFLFDDGLFFLILFFTVFCFSDTASVRVVPSVILTGVGVGFARVVRAQQRPCSFPFAEVPLLVV